METATLPFDNLTTNEPTNVPYSLPLYFIVIATFTSAASILGAIFLIFVYFKFPQVRSNSRKLLVFLSISDLLSAGGNFLGIVRYSVYYWSESQIQCFPPNTFCVIQSFMSTLGNLWSFFWTVCIAVYLYTVVVCESSAKADKYINVFHLVSWTIPVCVMIIAASEEVLGEDLTETTPGWCWVCTCSSHLSRSRQIVWMMLTGKFWEILAFILSATLYILIRYTLHKTIQRLKAALMQPETIRAITRVVRRMTFVPLIFFCLRIWGSVRFLIAVCVDEPINKYLNTCLLILQSFGDSGQGICNAVLYCLASRQIRELLVGSWCPNTTQPATAEPHSSSQEMSKTQPTTKAFDETPDLNIQHHNVESGVTNSGYQRY